MIIGILQRATDAKTNTDNSQIQERINLAYHSALTSGLGKVEEGTLKDEIKKEFNKTDSELEEKNWLDKTSVSGKWKITIEGVSLEVPAGTDETGGSNDESTKLYNALKDKTPQEIVNGVVVDGIETKFMGGSASGAYIEYNNQLYIISMNPTDYSVSAVTLTEEFIFFIRGQAFEASEGMTFGQWLQTYHPQGFSTVDTSYGTLICNGNEIIVYDPDMGRAGLANADCKIDTVIKQNFNYLTYHQ